MMKRMEKQLLLNSFSDIVKLSIETIQRVYNIEYAFLYTFSYVTYFNDAMGASMVFDFFQSSFQIAAILTQVLGNQITWVMFVFVSTFFVSMVFRLILYYYHANDVMYLSQRLSYSIWEANWFEQPNRLKRMILMFILRTQKPLTYRIGIFSVMTLQSCIYSAELSYSIYESNWLDQAPKVKQMILIFMLRTQESLTLSIGGFGVMSIQSMIAILKATYSYMMLMI
ncbi:hypothetical protein HUJ04_009993 [Dendroctonus ponderosae]|nr:hypothetical protein HUJ04_009993 [Dendroctonus ponderosae]